MLTAPPKELELQKKEKMQKLLEMLLKDYVKKSIRGSNLNIKDSSDLPMILKDIRGNLKQETREGYNLIDVSSGTLFNTTTQGVTSSRYNDEITLNGTANATTAFLDNCDFKELENGNTYTVKLIPLSGEFEAGAIGYRVMDSNGAQLFSSQAYFDSFKTTQQASISGEIAKIQVYFTSTFIGKDFKFKVLLIKGDEDKPYEKFGVLPSIKSPSPVKYVTGEFESYNKLNVEGVVDNIITDDFTITNNKDGTITINGVLTKSHQYSLSDVPLTYKNDKARFSFEVISGSANIKSGGQFLFIFYGGNPYEIDPVVVKSNVTDKYSEVYNITTKETTQRPYFHFGWTESVGGFAEFNNYRIRLQVTEGEEDKPYLPYGTIKNTYQVKIQNKNLAYNIRYRNATSQYQGVIEASYKLQKDKYYVISFDSSNTGARVYINQGQTFGFNVISKYSGLNCDGKRYYFIVKSIETKKFSVENIISKSYNDNIETGLLFNFMIEEIPATTDKEALTYTPTEFIEHQEQVLNLDIPTGYELYGETDYYYKKLDKWYVHNEYSKAVLKNLVWRGLGTTILSEKYRYVTFSLQDVLLRNINNSSKVGLYCNILNEGTPEDTFLTKENIAISPNGEIFIYADDVSTETNITKIMQLLEDTNAYLIYPLAEPTETEITDSDFIKELEDLMNLQSYYPETNISVEKLVENEETELPILDINYLIGMKQLQNQIDELNKKISQEE